MELTVPAAELQAAAGALALVPLLGVVLLLSLGSAYQWLALVAGPTAWFFLLLVVLLLDVFPLLGLLSLGQEGWIAFSPSAQWVRWLGGKMPPAPLWPALLLYAGLLVLSRWSLGVGLRRLEGAVDRKLEEMGVRPSPFPSGERCVTLRQP